MCPPPAEPIRPVGLLGDEVWVDRAEHAERIHRRRPRRDQDGADERRRDRHEAAAERPATRLEVHDPRGYDDHGRPPEDADAPDATHVDATA